MRRVIATVLVGLVASSCSGDAAPPPTTAATTSTAAPTTTTTAAPEFTTRDLFELVSPSLAFVTTDLGVGSGVLLEGGWVVTNSHVVWPFDEVRIVFPDGTELPRVPVVRSNAYEDLAVVGPVDVEAPQLSLEVDADYGIGDTVFLIGYPGEVEAFPTPAITQGVVSRIREWEAADLTFIQTDALIAGGQSGGALVDRTGALLGISGLGGFTEANFALVASAGDLAPRVESLIDGASPGRFNVKPLVGGEPATRHTVEFASYWHDMIFSLDVPAGTTVSVTLSDDDHVVDITDAIGYSIAPDEELAPSVEATTEFDEQHFVFVNATVTGPSSVTVESSHPLRLLPDPDDDLVVFPGDVVQGVLDVSGDLDVFRISLQAGQTITAAVDGLLDPLVWIDQIGNPGDALAFDDDSGGGLFGTNAEVVFTALEDGEYLVLVSDALFEEGAGYMLTIE